MKASIYNEFLEKKSIADELKHGKNLKEIVGISDERLDEIFDFACTLYNEMRYKDAGDVFFLLTNLSPQNFNYWQGLGFSSYQAQELNEAIMAYQCAMSIAPDNIEIYPYIIRTLCDLNDKDSAKFYYDLLTEENFPDNIEQLEEMRTDLNKLL